jgi:hypothetical protein
MALGSMGTPKKVDVNGTPIFICCDGCREGLLEEPEKYLVKLEAASTENFHESSMQMDLPPIGVPVIVEPHGNLPSIEVPQVITEPVKKSEHKPARPAKQVAGQPKEVVR